MSDPNKERFVGGPARMRDRVRPGAMLSRRLAKPLVATMLVAAVGLIPVGGANGAAMSAGHASAPKGGRHAHHRVIHAPGSDSAVQITAHDGKFWQGSTPLIMHGIMHSVSTPAIVERDLDTISGWGMNVVRLTFSWCHVETAEPVQHGSSWTHTWSSSYISSIQQDVAEAQAHGMWAVVALYPCDGDDSYFFGPSWLYTAPYNSKGKTYAETPEGRSESNQDFWTDPLRQSFTEAMWTWLAGQLASTPGILGYEVLNEPDVGDMAYTVDTAQTTLAVQLNIAQSIRDADPPRVIFFTTFAGYGPAVALADFGDWKTFGNVAFDVHDYFGARWGTGLSGNPDNDSTGVAMETLFDIANDGSYPYIGTTLNQVRYLQLERDSLKPWGIPIIVGEIGNFDGDIGSYDFFGTTTAAANDVAVSWCSDWGSNHGIADGQGSLEDFAWVVQQAAGDYPPA
jgi:hypothetical protein